MACLQRQTFFMKKQITLSQIKLIVFDIDGTLLNASHQLADRTKAIVRRCQQNGLAVSLATGKNWDAVMDLAAELEIDQPMILSNGTIIRNKKGEVIERVVLPPEALQFVIKYCEENDYDLTLYYDKDIYAKKITHNVSLMYEFCSKHIIEIGSWDAIADKFPEIHKFMIVERESPQDLYKIEKIMRSQLGDMVEYCQSQTAMFEVMAKGVSKGSALRKVCTLLGIDIGSVLAFGDGNNDVELLTTAGWGVTLANGSMIAKANADLLVPSIERCGPAQFLEYLFREQTSV